MASVSFDGLFSCREEGQLVSKAICSHDPFSSARRGSHTVGILGR